MKKPKVIEQIRRLVVTKRTCPVCQKTFEGTGKQKFDSNACKMKDWYERNKTVYNAKRKAQRKKTTV